MATSEKAKFLQRKLQAVKGVKHTPFARVGKGKPVKSKKAIPIAIPKKSTY